MAKTNQPAYKVGDYAIFKKYEGEAPDPAIFNEGDPLMIIGFPEDGNGYFAALVGPDDQPYPEGHELHKKRDTVFEVEIEPAVLEPDGATTADVKPEELAAAEKPAKKPAKSAAKKAEAAPKKPAKTEAKAKAEPAKEPATKPAKKPAAKKAAAKTEEPAQTEQADISVPEPTAKPTEAASVRELLSKEDAISAALKLVTRKEETEFTLGGILKHIHDEGIYKERGFDGPKGFANFCEQYLDVDYRKARYLMTIYTVFMQVGLDEKTVAQIGWSKAKELARIPVDRLRQDIETLVAFATTNSRDDLVGHMQTTYAGDLRTRGGQVKTTKFTFVVEEDAGDLVREALQAACREIDTDNLNAAFQHIVNEWRSLSANESMGEEDYLALMETKFGKRYEVVEEDEDQTETVDA